MYYYFNNGPYLYTVSKAWNKKAYVLYTVSTLRKTSVGETAYTAGLFAV
jgi:hypothetical protein